MDLINNSMTNETIGLNTATANSWIAIIPYHIIQPESEDYIAFNLSSFNFSGLIMSGAEIPRFGEMFPVPSGVVETDKIISFRYKPDSEWKQYEFMFNWFDKLQNNKKADHEEYNEWMSGQMVDIKVYLLNEYKKPRIKWTFNSAWLKEFGELDMVYDAAGGTGLDHGFALQYMDYNFQRVTTFDE